MVLVDVVESVIIDDCQIEQVTSVRSNRQILKHESIIELRMLNHHDDILNSDTKLSILVVPRLIRDTHALNKFGGGTPGNTLWTLVHAEHAADSVSGTVLVVKTSFEEVLSREDIEVFAGESPAFRPYNSLDI